MSHLTHNTWHWQDTISRFLEKTVKLELFQQHSEKEMILIAKTDLRPFFVNKLEKLPSD